MKHTDAMAKSTKQLKTLVAKNGEKPVNPGTAEMAALIALACRAPKRK